jgi:selenocysteine-specific elongation factor
LDYNFSPDVFKIKFREGAVDKLYDADTLIVKSMFKKETNLSLFKDMNVVLETGERGRIIGPFGKSGKIKVELLDEIEMETLEKLDVGVSNEKPEKIKVHLRFMKKAFDKSAGLIQF